MTKTFGYLLAISSSIYLCIAAYGAVPFKIGPLPLWGFGDMGMTMIAVGMAGFSAFIILTFDLITSKS